MERLSKKHWTAFGVIVLFNVSTVVLVYFINGILLSVFNVFLCIFLIHSFLGEPLSEYGIHLRNIPAQFISGVLLAFVIFVFLCVKYASVDAIKYLFFQFIEQFSSGFAVFLYLASTLLYLIPEEIVYRGFLPAFFQKLFCRSLPGVFLSAVFFAFIHFPIGRSWHQVIFSFIIGLIYGYLGIKEPEKYTVFSLSLAHFLHNVFVDVIH